jgi:pilus assembly protein CpaE
MSILLENSRMVAESLAPAISPDTKVVPDLVALRRLLADEPDHDLVVIGPDVDMSTVADFAGAERVQRPALGIVLVRRRLDTATLKDAIRAGVREVVKVDDLIGLTDACLASVDLTRQVRGDASGPPASTASPQREGAARRRCRRTWQPRWPKWAAGCASWTWTWRSATSPSRCSSSLSEA